MMEVSCFHALFWDAADPEKLAAELKGAFPDVAILPGAQLINAVRSGDALRVVRNSESATAYEVDEKDVIRGPHPSKFYEFDANTGECTEGEQLV